ncbi:TonB-dependent receptor [Gemmatimonas sp.]|uniref:TonB-dependent receptor n=1 Tax=Gemmatimonas sp. TaxID=1962908 RepID=UPI00286DDF86|nr:TonB-dependent receptor [Gemmatimonas sp.]
MIIMKSSWPRTNWPLSLAALILASPALLSAQSAGTVAGSVSTAEGNLPVERATISVRGRDARATTDVAGRYQISELPVGTYWIVARAIGLLPDSVQVSVVAGQTARGTLALKRSTTTLQQVAITAQKRSESAQDVPVAVTALTADFLTKQSIQQFDALSAYVPGLNVQLQSPNNPGFVIRGITSDDGTSYVEPRVSVFQDGVSISKSRGSVVELFDLERVEVLKGPQGTLFGRGAQIGAVHVIQNKAVNARESMVAIGGGTFNELYATGMVNAPLVDGKLFGRVAAIYNKRDGFITNAGGGTLNGKNTGAVRASLRWLPTTASTVDIIVNAQTDDSPGTSFKSTRFAPPAGDATPFARAGLNGGDSLGISRQVGGLTVLYNQQLSPAWTLTSISAGRRFYSDEAFDADGTLAPVLQFREVAEGSQASQELRFAYDRGGKLTGFAGASGFWERGSQRVPFNTDERSLFALLAGQPIVNANGTANLSIVNNPSTGLPFKTSHTEQYQNFGQTTAAEVFADATYTVSRLSLTAGMRGTYEQVENAYEVQNSATRGSLGALLGAAPNNLFAPTNGRKEGTGVFRSVVGRAIANFDLGRDFMGYASFSKGRRPNVVVVNASAVRTLNEETVLSTEGGLKGQLAGGRAQFDVSAFSYRYNNFQTSITRLTPGGLVNETLDGGRAKAWGFEGSVRGQLNAQTSVFATVGYTDAKFDSTDANGNKQARAGNRFRLTPMHSYSAGLSLDATKRRFGQLYVSPNTTYRGKVFFEDTNLPAISEKGQLLFNVRAGLRLPDDRTELTIVARNLFDQQYIIDAGNTGGAFGIPTFIAGAPRFVTVQVSRRF